MDANGDGEVLAVLDLGTDESLVEAGLAREVVNRVQKLRKKAGLVATDVVDVFVGPASDVTGRCCQHMLAICDSLKNLPSLCLEMDRRQQAAHSMTCCKQDAWLL